MYGNMTTFNNLGLTNILSKLDTSSRTVEALKSATSKGSAFETGLLDAIAATQTGLGSENGAHSDRVSFMDNGLLNQLYRDSVFQSVANELESSRPLTSTASSEKTGQSSTTESTASQSEEGGGTAEITPYDPVPVDIPISGSPRQIVMAIGQANSELLQKINGSTSVDERLGYVSQLRDNIITGLRSAGYKVEAAESPDSIYVNGELRDVVRKYRTPGRIAKVQYHRVRERNVDAANTENQRVKNAIFKASESGVNLLMKLRSSHSASEQKHLASMIQGLMVDHLNSNGFSASTTNSPDKIVVNGTTYDFIRGYGGENAQFSAMVV